MAVVKDPPALNPLAMVLMVPLKGGLGSSC